MSIANCEIEGRPLQVGDIVFVTNLDKKEIIRTRIHDVWARSGDEGPIYRGRYSMTQYFFTRSAIDLTLHDALVNFGINLLDYSENLEGFE